MSQPPSRARRLVGFGAGILLLAAACYAALSQRTDALRAWDSVRTAAPMLIVLALLLPVVNIVVTSLSFWVQLRRHGRLGAVEMTALIFAAWLLNYLPLRPGMLGRFAYHKAVNGIGLKDCVRATVVGMALGALAVLAVLAVAVATPQDSGTGTWALTLSLPALPVGCAALAGIRRGWWWVPAVFLCRYADMLIWVLRYWVVFRLVGSSLSIPQSAAIAAVCQLTLNVPLVGNGLGLREWAVGLTASRLPPGLFDARGRIDMSVGLAADLANRIAELVIAVPAGLLCAAWLARRQRA